MIDVPALEQLMGAYFHQDWDMDGDEWDVVDLFIRDEPEAIKTLPGEIDQTLATFSSESDLEAFVTSDLGGCYAADLNGGTYRAWLTQIADRVRTATGQR